MKARVFFGFLLIVYSLNGLSQNAEKPNPWILKYNLTQAIDIFAFPTIAIAAEKKLTHNFSINAEIGNQFYDFKNKNVDTIFNASKGFKTNIEGRLYWKNIEKKNGSFYNGVQVFYKQNQFTRTISYTQKQAAEGAPGYIDNFGVKKSASGVIFLIGYQYLAPCNFILESYFGVGLMNKKIKNDHREFDKDKDSEIDGVDQMFNLASADLSEASGTAAIVTMGFRVGYKF